DGGGKGLRRGPRADVHMDVGHGIERVAVLGHGGNGQQRQRREDGGKEEQTHRIAWFGTRTIAPGSITPAPPAKARFLQRHRGPPGHGGAFPAQPVRIAGRRIARRACGSINGAEPRCRREICPKASPIKIRASTSTRAKRWWTASRPPPRRRDVPAPMPIWVALAGCSTSR